MSKYKNSDVVSDAGTKSGLSPETTPLSSDPRIPQAEEKVKGDIDKEWKVKGKEYGTYEKANTPKKTDENTKVNKALDTGYTTLHFRRIVYPVSPEWGYISPHSSPPSFRLPTAHKNT